MSAKKAVSPRVITPALVRLDRQLLFGNLWIYIVSICAKKPMHAYALPSEIEKKFGFKPSRIMCYIVAYRLKGEGLLTIKEQGRRVCYVASELGKSQLAQARHKLQTIGAKL